MSAATDHTKAIDPGIVTLGLFLRLHGVAADVKEIRQRCGTTTISISAILNCAKKFGLTARVEPANWKQLTAVRLPAIAVLRDGSFLLIAKVSESGVVTVRPPSPRPEDIAKADFETVWSGRLAHTGVYNSRGVHWRGEGSDQERELAGKYRKWGEALQVSHPFVAATPGVSAIAVTAGIVVSTIKLSAVLGWLTSPAASVAVTV